MNRPNPNPNDPLTAPPRLVDGLRRVAGGQGMFIPRTVDEAILRAGRQHLEPPPRRAWLLRHWLAGLSTATAAIVAGLLVWPDVAPGTLVREDVNGDGRVDIVDALTLAQGAEAGTAEADLNNDGRVDGRDVALVAARAVELEPGT